MAGLSAYELRRLKNIEDNNRCLRELGLQPAERPRQERPRSVAKPRPPLRPSRASARLKALARKRDGSTSGSENEGEAEICPFRPVPRAPVRARARVASLTEDEVARLGAHPWAGNTEPLTESETEAARLAALALEDCGGISAKRRTLRELASEKALRWPPWLEHVERLVGMGVTSWSRDATMLALEAAACGVGLRCPTWPAGVGVLLSNSSGDGESEGHDAPEALARRPLTLVSSIAELKHEGRMLECSYGRDTTNGWAYNHALGKMTALQHALLERPNCPPPGRHKPTGETCRAVI